MKVAGEGLPVLGFAAAATLALVLLPVPLLPAAAAPGCRCSRLPLLLAAAAPGMPTWTLSAALPLHAALHPDFNLSKLLEEARPEASLTSAGASNPIWLVGGAGEQRLVQVLLLARPWQQMLAVRSAGTSAAAPASAMRLPLMFN